MSLSRVTYVGDGTTNLFSVTFSYISKTHVKVYINGAEDTEFTWLTATSIAPASIPALYDEVLIKRVTPTDPLVDFEDGSNLTEELLDSATRQSLYVVEESKDDSVDSLTVAIPDGSISPIKLSSSFGAWITLITESAVRTALDIYSKAETAALILAATLTKATTGEAQTGSDDATYMTPLKTAEAITALSPDTSLGVGQTWQELMASRSFNVTYTNTTGRTIVAMVGAVGSPQHCLFYVVLNDGVDLSSACYQGSTSHASAALYPSITAIIPAGWTYKFVNNLGASKHTWNELR